jgi:hypothetical protein
VRQFFYLPGPVGNMQRATARVVLLVLLLGVLVPAANAVGMDRTPACCRRTPLHSATRGMADCHEMAGAVADSNDLASTSDQAVISRGSCPNHECCRALARSQWAQVAQSEAARNLAALSLNVASHAPNARTIAPCDDHSGRAPPAL